MGVVSCTTLFAGDTLKLQAYSILNMPLPKISLGRLRGRQNISPASLLYLLDDISFLPGACLHESHFFFRFHLSQPLNTYKLNRL